MKDEKVEEEAQLTGGEVDVGEEDDVGGDEGDQFGDADLLFKVDVHHVILTQAAVHRRVELLQTGTQAAQKPEHTHKHTHVIHKAGAVIIPQH